MLSKILLVALVPNLLAAEATEGPCDIYDAAPEGTPCVAAHSTVRALYAKYDGPLYQLRQNHTFGRRLNITVLQPGGIADAAPQEKFCGKGHCVIERIFDQSPRGNHLDIAPPGGAHKEHDIGVDATKESLIVGGHKVYAAYFEGGMGYRIDKGNGVAVKDEPESMYAIFSGKHFNSGCCFDYGNAESNNLDTGVGSMEAIYFGSAGRHGTGGQADGPWVGADLENGLIYGGEDPETWSGEAMPHEYVTAMVKGGSHGFGLKGGNAQSGRLTTLYDGPRPNRYQPMKKQGSIILGIGGDNSDSAVGTFYEGCMTSGLASNATDAKIQANIVAAGYGR